MLGYGHDESDPTPDGMFATNFVEFFVCISLVFVDFSWCVRCIIAIRQQCFGKPFAAKWQTVSSRRGPIYRARVYGNTHKMTNGNVRAMM